MVLGVLGALIVVDDGIISSAAAALCRTLLHVHVENIHQRYDGDGDRGTGGDGYKNPLKNEQRKAQGSEDDIIVAEI